MQPTKEFLGSIGCDIDTLQDTFGKTTAGVLLALSGVFLIFADTSVWSLPDFAKPLVFPIAIVSFLLGALIVVGNKEIKTKMRLLRSLPTETRFEIYLSSASTVFLRPLMTLLSPDSYLTRTFQIAYLAGCHGVEWLLSTPIQRTTVESLFSYSQKSKVGCRFHEMWTAMSLSTRVLKLLRLVPSLNQAEQMLQKATKKSPTVTFSLPSGLCSANTCLQTGGNKGEGVDSIESLVSEVQNRGGNLAFDAMHLLELQFGGFLGVCKTWRDDPATVKTFLGHFLRQHKNLISEIHFYNFTLLPTWLHDSTLVPDSLKLAFADVFCKNRWPWDGVMDLEGFIFGISLGEWKGAIILEIHPLRMFFDPIGKLRRSIRVIGKSTDEAFELGMTLASWKFRQQTGLL